MAGSSTTLVESFKGNVKKLKMKELSLSGDDVRGANEREEKFLKKTLGSLERARNRSLSRIEIEVKALQHTLVEQNSVTPSVFGGFEKADGNEVNKHKFCSDARKSTSRLLGLENRKISSENNPKCVKKALNTWIDKAIRKANKTPEPLSKPRPRVDSSRIKQDDLLIQPPSPPQYKETLDEIPPKPRRLLLSRQRSTPNMTGTSPLVAPPECNSPGILRRKTSSSEFISIASPSGTIERNLLSGGCPSISDSVTKNRVHFNTPDIHEGKRRSGKWSVEGSPPCITRRDHACTVPGLVSPNSSPMFMTKGLKTVRSCPTLRSAHVQQVQVFPNPARSSRLGSDQRPDSKREPIPQLSAARINRRITSTPDLKLLDLENERGTLPYLRPHGKCRSDSDINRKEWNSSPLEQPLSDGRLNSKLQERVNAFLASLETRKSDDENFVEP